MNRFVANIVGAALAAVVGVGCAARWDGPEDPEGPPAGDAVAEALARSNDVVILRFEDRSVPPAYHRSHTIAITRTEIRRTVDVYGTLLDDRHHAIAAGVFDEVIAALARNYVAAVALPTESDGCTGGTGHRVVVERADAIVLDGNVYHCQGDSGTLGGAVESFAAEVEQIADRELGKDHPKRHRGRSR